MFLDWKSVVCEPLNGTDLLAVNDNGSKLSVYLNKIEIKFVDEKAPRVFYLDTLELYYKIERYCKVVCFDTYSKADRKLMFELDIVPGSIAHTIRVAILNTTNDNFRIEVVRSELLAALAILHF